MPQALLRHGVIGVVRIVAQIDIGKRIDDLHAVHEAGCHGTGRRECRSHRLVTNADPLPEQVGINGIGRLQIRDGHIAEIAHILELNRLHFDRLPILLPKPAQRERSGRIQGVDGGKQTCPLILRETLFHNFLDFQNQFRIRGEPIFNLSAIKVSDGKVLVFGHKTGQFFRRIGNLVFGGVVGNVEILIDLILLRRDIFAALDQTHDLIQVPALGRVLDQQAPTDARQRVRHIRRNADTSFDLIQSLMAFLP